MRHRFVTLLLIVSLMPASAAVGQLAPAPEGTFTVAVIPDTQLYRGQGTKAEPDSTDEVTNLRFDELTQWISDNLDAQRIVFVTHVGDIVDINNHDQWQVARRCMDRLHGRVPYGISVGNHDMTGSGDSSLFQEYFPASRFEEFDWYGGTFAGNPERPSVSDNNANSYQLVSAEGVDLIFVHLECNAPDDVLQWASEVLQEHAARHAIITTHMWLGPLERPTAAEGFVDDLKGRMVWVKRHGQRGNSPQQMWDKLMSKHPSIFMVLAGDQSRAQAMRQTSDGEHGNAVHEIMFDYGGGRNIRLMRFMPAQSRIQVITYDIEDQSLVESSSRVEDIEQWQFTIEHDLSGRALSPAATGPAAEMVACPASGHALAGQGGVRWAVIEAASRSGCAVSAGCP